MNKRIYTYLAYLVLIAIPATVVLCVSMMPLVSLPLSYLAVDSVVGGITIAMLCLVLKYTIRFGRYTSLPPIQKYVNYSALALLFIIAWVGVGMLLLLALLPQEVVRLFVPTIPIRILIAILVYGFVVLLYEYAFLRVEYAEKILQPTDDSSEPKVADEQKAALPSEVQKQEVIEHVAVKNGQKIDLIFISDIVCIQAEGDYVMIYTAKAKFLKEQTMKYFSDNLPKNKFVRVHRSGIVNIDFISRIESYEKQQQIITLQNNLQVKASAAGYKELKRVLNL